MKIPLGFSISLFLFLYGCVSLPKDQQRENLLEPPTLSEAVNSRLQSDLFALGEWPEKEWWKLFRSEELNGLIQLGLLHNPSIQSIERKMESAKQNAKRVRSQLFPLVFFNANETWEFLSRNGLYRALNPKVPLNANLIDLTLSFTYEFDFWGKNRNLFLAALGKRRAQEAEAEEVKLITTTAIAQVYFALKTNLERQRLLQELVEVKKETWKLAELLQEKALFSQLEPLLLEEEWLEGENQLLSVKEEVAQNRHLLNTLVGRGADHALALSNSLEPLPQKIAIPLQLSADLLARRPDLMAQIWRVEALAHSVGAAKADFFPNISLVGFGGTESVGYEKLFLGSSKTWGLQPALHLPIFTAGAIRANLREQKALFDAAVFDYNQLILKSAQEVADLLIVTETAFEQETHQRASVGSARKRLQLMELNREKGLANLLDTYALRIECLQRELQDLSLVYGQYATYIKLIKALGGGYLSDFALPLKKEAA